MRKALLLSSFICFTFMSPSFGQTIQSDTLKASKLANKASKLYSSGKEKKISKAIDLYKQAGSMGLPSACRFLSDYYIGTTPPDVESSIHWTEILGDMGDSLSIVKLVDIYSGNMSSSGYPSDANIPKLTEWSKVLASKGSLKGMESVAACCLVSGDTTQAMGWFEKAADRGSLPSQVALAKLYSSTGINNVPSLAFKYAEQASEQGEKECTYMVGNMYMTGYGCEQDYAKAYSYFEKCQDEPIDDLALNMAFCKIQMNDGKVDATALSLLTSEAEKGNATAQRVLGDCYANGDGVALDLSEALKWYEKAAEQGDPYSMYATSVFLLKGDAPIVQDHAKGISYLEKAASSGLPAAQHDLALSYIGGQFVEKDVSKGLDLLEQACASGNPYSQVILATIYYQGELVSADLPKALKLFQSAAVQGLPEAQYNTGLFYINDAGTAGLTDEERLVTEELVKQNESSNGSLTNKQIGVYWLRQASDNGHPGAQANLAMLMLNGTASGSESEAVALLQKSSENGISDADYTLGTLYYNGDAGLRKDVQKGVSYLKKAADKGNLQAQMELGMLYLNGTPEVAQNSKSGFKYMKMAADQGLPAAMYYISVCYFQGIGVTANKSEAKQWLRKASSQNYDPEIKKMAEEALKNL